MLPNVLKGLLPQKRFLTTFQGIAPNIAPVQTVTVNIPALYNIVDLWLQCLNITTAMVQEIRLKIGGNIIQKWAGPDLDTRLQYDRQPAFGVNAIIYSILKLPLRRMGLRGGTLVLGPNGSILNSGSARDLAMESTLNCGIAGGGFAAVDKVTMEIDFINTGALQPSCQVFGRCTDPVEGGPGLVYRVDKQNKQVPNGEITWTKTDFGLDALRLYLNRLTFFPVGGGTLDGWQLRYGTNDWWTISQDMLIQGNLEDDLRTPQPGMYVLDFQEEGWGDTMLDLAAGNSDILLQVQGANTVGNMVCYVESLGLPFSKNG